MHCHFSYCQTRNLENPIATLQLCVGRHCLIFQILLATLIPESLVNFLGNPSYIFVGVGIENDVEKLRKDYGVEVAKTVDLRTLATDVYGVREFKKAGLLQLARIVLGKEINKPKSVTMSRWDDQCLTLLQVQYASVDAFLSFQIGMILINGNHN
ncbi:putative DNA helicase [Helianthus annuus]|uniref:DNA helicase n=1 Tax=Helianthus annuus TaxID=4232 RepID=A0A251TQR7_HELAN|nr:Werner Syndrome-like exonuclease [Helianthus annuus]KAF5788740.1 putative DNA helicase [Helianthus annuus]